MEQKKVSDRYGMRDFGLIRVPGKFKGKLQEKLVETDNKSEVQFTKIIKNLHIKQTKTFLSIPIPSSAIKVSISHKKNHAKRPLQSLNRKFMSTINPH